VKLEQATAALTQVIETEQRLRQQFDEILAQRRALDRRKLDALDALLHGPVADALALLDGLEALDIAVLLAAMSALRVDRTVA
jgi:hypothetical protein